MVYVKNRNYYLGMKVKDGIPKGIPGPKSRQRSHISSDIAGEDFLFLLGLSLFILFLVLAHPSTPSVSHQTIIFWMSVALLFLSMAPDYLNRQVAMDWLNEYRSTRFEVFYRRIWTIAENSDRYFSSDKFFILGVLLTILAIGALFYTGEIQEWIFGISYGVFMRALLV